MKITRRPSFFRKLKQPKPPMQRMVDEMISGEQVAITALAYLIISKLEAQGVPGISEHVDWVITEVQKRHRNEDGLTWSHPLRTDEVNLEGDFSVAFDSEDFERLSKATDDAVSVGVEKAIETFFLLTLDDVRKQAGEAVRRRAEDYEEFRRRLVSRWEIPLHLLALQIEISTQFGSDMSAWLRSQACSSDSALIEALLRLHARACQIASEVEVLLQAGFADGAMSRWRTLHEVTTVAIFLQESGNEVAQRYLDHLAVDSFDLARKVRAASEGDVSDVEIADLQAKVDALKVKYGKEFAEEYGWSAAVLNNKNPKFVHIEKAVSFEKLRPYYKLASTTVHAGPKGAFWKLGFIDGSENVLLAGPSNAGLAEAGRLTALSLANVSTTLMLQHTVVDSTVWVRIILELSKEIEEAFLRAERELEDEEKEIRFLDVLPSDRRRRKLTAGKYEKLSERLRRRLRKR